MDTVGCELERKNFLIFESRGLKQCQLSALATLELTQKFHTYGFSKLTKNEISYLVLAFFSCSLLNPRCKQKITISRVQRFKKYEPTSKKSFLDFIQQYYPYIKKSGARKLYGNFIAFVCDDKIYKAGQKQLNTYLLNYAKHEYRQYDQQFNNQDKVLNDITKLLDQEKCTEVPAFIASLLATLKILNNKIPARITSKILCDHGVHYYTVHYNQDSLMDQCYVVEGFTSGTKNIPTFKVIEEELRLQCPYQLLVRKPTFHNKEESCALCKTCPFGVECETFCKKKNAMTNLCQSFRVFLVGSAANVVYAQQSNHEPFSSIEYPYLSNFFNECNKCAQELGFSENNPSTFVAEHVHTNRHRHVVDNEPRYIDQSFEEISQSMNQLTLNPDEHPESLEYFDLLNLDIKEGNNNENK